MQKTIHKYYLFQFLGNVGFFSPVIVLFWQQNGLSMTQIMLLQSIYSIGVLLLELPTGAFADYFGKRNSLLLGSVFWAVGMFWYGSSHLFWQFVVGELLVGIGSAFFSGADRAYLHQVLSDDGQENKFKQVEGKARGIIQIAQGVGSIVGGFMASISLGFTITATGVNNIVNFGVISSFPKTKKEEHTLGYLQIIRESANLIYRHKELLWLTLFYATFYALVWPMQFYAQVYFKAINLPIYQFGIAFFLCNFIGAFFLSFTHVVEQKAKKYIYLFLTTSIIIAFILLGFFQTIFLVPLWSLFIIANFMNQTIVSSRVLALVPQNKAATILSFHGFTRRIIYAAIIPFLGYTSDHFSFKNTLLIYAAFSFIILFSLLSVKKKFI